MRGKGEGGREENASRLPRLQLHAVLCDDSGYSCLVHWRPTESIASMSQELVTVPRLGTMEQQKLNEGDSAHQMPTGVPRHDHSFRSAGGDDETAAEKFQQGSGAEGRHRHHGIDVNMKLLLPRVGV